LLSIINDILDFSKIEAGKLELEQQPFSIREVVESSLDLIAPKAADKGLEIAYIVDGDTPDAIVGDVTRVRQILLAEDNLVNQKVALRILEKLGYRADVAANGLEVLEALERQHYDMVLMDIQMPEMDGEEATRQIIDKYPGDERPRIVAMTAHAMDGDREHYLDAGMDDYVSKPVRVQELVDALERCQPHKSES